MVETATVALEPADALSQPCPECKHGRAHRSHARTVVERVKRQFTPQSLFRCDGCGWRGWLMPLSFVDPAADALELPVPDLGTLDRAFQPRQAELRPSFSPRNLQ